MSNLKPVNYKIRLEPDLDTFKFSGKMEVLLNASSPVREIPFNALDLTIGKCQVTIDGDPRDCSFDLDSSKEQLSVSLPMEMSGEVHVIIDYSGEINDKMAGFYRSRYTVGGEERYAAVTQFEESEARRAFPCFDHPLMKATFDIEMVVDDHLVAISNGPILEEHPAGPGKKRVLFQRTPVMSTYLLFFGVGDFEFIEDDGDVLVRVATMPEMTQYGRFGLDFGRKALAFSEDFYGVKYPLPKLDLIAIEDFAFGAMENWGAITFRENLLLHYPEVTSKAGAERICEVIAHEIAHQWFGNLVTPSDWKYLWLNESFATYFGYGIVHHYYPEWDIWDQFLSGTTDVALGRDALHETFSIEIPGGEHVVINASTAPIIYNKGGSILRQVEGYVGPDNFKDGLRRYLEKHQYACASSHHLWEALEEVSEQPITRMMKSWIEQPGFPLIEAKRDGQVLTLTQERFTYLSNDSEQTWVIPLNIELFYGNGESGTLSALMDDKMMELELDPAVEAYKINQGQTGFYRVKYRDQETLEALGKLAAAGKLDAVDRWGMQNDLYAFLRCGDVSIDTYLDFLSHYAEEEAYLPLVSMADNLHHAYLVFEGEKRERVATLGRTLLERVLGRIGYEPDEAENHTTSVLRDQIIWHAVMYGSEKAQTFGMEKFNHLMKDDAKIHPDIMRSIMRIGAMNGEGEIFEWFDQRFQTTESEHERMNILGALGSFRDEDLVKRAQQYTLDKVPSRNKFVPISYMSVNQYALALMWPWYQAKLVEIEKFHPMHYERVIASIVPLCGISYKDEVEDFFREYMEKQEKAADVIKLSLEKLEINTRMRNK